MTTFLPADGSLPFFAYGAFRPGELAFLRLKPFVERREDAEIPGQLLIRDGLPIAKLADANSRIVGCLLHFAPDKVADAYDAIADLEPEKQYCWASCEVNGRAANILAGKSPDKGSAPSEEAWSGRCDPLFTAALDVIDETLQQNQDPAWDLKPLFRLEMAYLLLWTAIERYASLRYHLGRENAWAKVSKIADEPAFRASLASRTFEPRSVQRADDPTKKVTLDASNPKKSLEYYYQLRSNLVHRGKGVIGDHERIRGSLTELLALFRVTLKAAFEESAR